MGSDAGQAADRIGRCGRVLRHPVFVVAVAVLLLNDRWWKLAAPGLVTGKLSDLAGLIVAGVLMSAAFVLVGVEARWAAVRSTVLVGVLFTLMKSTGTGAAVAEAAWTSLNGGPNRVVVDPTDLVALAVLPIVPWVWSSRATAVPTSGRVARASRMVAAVVVLGAGVTATTATSCSTPAEVDAVVPGENGLLLALSDGSTVAWSADQGESWSSTTTTEVIGGSATSIVVGANGSEYVVRDTVFVGEDGSVLPPPTEPDPALGPSFTDADATTLPQPQSGYVASTEACIDDRCWHVVEGAVVRNDRSNRIEFSAIEEPSSGCGVAGEVSSLIELDRPEGPVLVASVGSQGIAVSSGDGHWERMPIAGAVLPSPPEPSRAGIHGGLAVGLVAAAAALAWFVPIRPTQQRYRTRGSGARAKVVIAVFLTTIGAVSIGVLGATDGTDWSGGLVGLGFRTAGWGVILLALPFAYSGSREFRFPTSERTLDR